MRFRSLGSTVTTCAFLIFTSTATLHSFSHFSTLNSHMLNSTSSICNVVLRQLKSSWNQFYSLQRALLAHIASLQLTKNQYPLQFPCLMVYKSILIFWQSWIQKISSCRKPIWSRRLIGRVPRYYWAWVMVNWCYLRMRCFLVSLCVYYRTLVSKCLKYRRSWNR